MSRHHDFKSVFSGSDRCDATQMTTRTNHHINYDPNFSPATFSVLKDPSLPFVIHPPHALGLSLLSPSPACPTHWDTSSLSCSSFCGQDVSFIVRLRGWPTTHTHDFAVGCCGDFSCQRVATPRCEFASPPDANVLFAPLCAQNGSESSTLPMLRMCDGALRRPVHVRPITGFVHRSFWVKNNLKVIKSSPLAKVELNKNMFPSDCQLNKYI